MFRVTSCLYTGEGGEAGGGAEESRPEIWAFSAEPAPPAPLAAANTVGHVSGHELPPHKGAGADAECVCVYLSTV